MSEDEDIEMILSMAKEKKEKTIDNLIPSSVPFTVSALKKAKMIGNLVKKVGGQDYEWSAFLLAEKDDTEYVVRDLILQKGQKASWGNYYDEEYGEVVNYAGIVMPGDALSEASQIIKERNEREGTNYYPIGWIHGHGDANHLGPSGTDKENFKRVINSVSLNTERVMKTPLNLIETKLIKNIEDGKITFSGKAMEDATIEYEVDEERARKFLERNGLEGKATALLDSLLESTEMNFFQSDIIGFSYFVIMSNKQEVEPYAAIGTLSQKAITKTSSEDLLERKITKVTVDNDIKVNSRSLEKEIKENIDFPAKYNSSYPYGQTYVLPGTNIPVTISGLGNLVNKSKGRKFRGKKRASKQGAIIPINITPQTNASKQKNGLWISIRAIDYMIEKMKQNVSNNEQDMQNIYGFLEMLSQVDEIIAKPALQNQVIDRFFETFGDKDGQE